MSAPFHLIMSPEAAADLQAIHDVISKDSLNNAARMIEKILDGINTLKTVPHHNVVARQSAKVLIPFRSLPIKPYIVYFQVLDQQHAVQIHSVVHGARRQPRFD
jgi:plasmid stabilization system protein ParE